MSIYIDDCRSCFSIFGFCCKLEGGGGIRSPPLQKVLENKPCKNRVKKFLSYELGSQGKFDTIFHSVILKNTNSES